MLRAILNFNLITYYPKGTILVVINVVHEEIPVIDSFPLTDQVNGHYKLTQRAGIFPLVQLEEGDG
jgi:hypothetical protein